MAPVRPKPLDFFTLPRLRGGVLHERDDVVLSMRRFYGLAAEDIGVAAARTHAADGSSVGERASEVAVTVGTADAELRAAVEANRTWIAGEVLAESLTVEDTPSGEVEDINEHAASLVLSRV